MAGYGFEAGHPFGTDRFGAFKRECIDQGLEDRVICLDDPAPATAESLARFHTPEFIDKVERLSAAGKGFLDQGDTPARPGIYQSALAVVGASLEATDTLMAGTVDRVFIPIGGLHHGARNAASGFCVFNDCGVVIETLRKRYDIQRTCYIDIDVHHGDGVFYAFENDPDAGFADIHQDGRPLFPGTGHAEETGQGAAAGTKLNIPLPAGSGDAQFKRAWEEVEAYVEGFKPEFILFQCGADGLQGDPLAALKYSAEAHRYAAERLCVLADRHAEGRLVAWGGGGYNRDNLARAWCAVVKTFADMPVTTKA